MLVQSRQDTVDDFYSGVSQTIITTVPDSYVEYGEETIQQYLSYTTYDLSNNFSTMEYLKGYYCYMHRYNDGRLALSLGLDVQQSHNWMDEPVIDGDSNITYPVHTIQVISSAYITNTNGKKLYFQYASGTLTTPSVYIGEEGGLFLEFQCNLTTGIFQFLAGKTYSFGGCLPKFYAKNITISTTETSSYTAEPEESGYELIYDLTSEFVFSYGIASQVLLHLRTYDPTFMMLELVDCTVLTPSKLNLGGYFEGLLGGAAYVSTSDVLYAVPISPEMMDSADSDGNITTDLYKYNVGLVQWDPAGATCSALAQITDSGSNFSMWANNNTTYYGVVEHTGSFKYYFYIDPYLHSVWSYGGTATATQQLLSSLKMCRSLGTLIPNSLNLSATFPIDYDLYPQPSELAALSQCEALSGQSLSQSTALSRIPDDYYEPSPILPVKMSFAQQKEGVLLSINLGYNYTGNYRAIMEFFMLLRSMPLPITQIPSCENPTLPPPADSEEVELGTVQIPVDTDNRFREFVYAPIGFSLQFQEGLQEVVGRAHFAEQSSEWAKPFEKEAFGLSRRALLSEGSWYLNVQDIDFYISDGFINKPFTFSLLLPRFRLKLQEWHKELFAPYTSGYLNNYINIRVQDMATSPRFRTRLPLAAEQERTTALLSTTYSERTITQEQSTAQASTPTPTQANASTSAEPLSGWRKHLAELKAAEQSKVQETVESAAQEEKPKPKVVSSSIAKGYKHTRERLAFIRMLREEIASIKAEKKEEVKSTPEQEQK